MSYITWDYHCPTCHTTEERFVKKAEMDKQFCGHCRSLDTLVRMERRPAAPPTTFTFADKSSTKKERRS